MIYLVLFISIPLLGTIYEAHRMYLSGELGEHSHDHIIYVCSTIWLFLVLFGFFVWM